MGRQLRVSKTLQIAITCEATTQTLAHPSQNSPCSGSPPETMRHGTPYLFGQSEDLALFTQATADRCCYSSDSQKSSNHLAWPYSVATYELGQVRTFEADAIVLVA